MTSHQQPQISQAANDYCPEDATADYLAQNNYDEQQYSSDTSSCSDDDMTYIKQSTQVGKGVEHTSKVYHENQFTKIDQKMHLAKIEHHENQQLVKEKRNKDKVQRATVEQVLDPRTMTILKKLINNGTFTEINGCLSTGKEANVYYAVKESEQGKKEYAVKIYKTSILVFKDRQRYVQGEFRFRRGYCSTNPRKMVKMWAQKQLRNLNRIDGIIPCPVPLLVKTNVLVMDFIGEAGIPAPKLKQIQKSPEQFSHIYLEMLTIMRLLYQQCKLVHADLSEYNLLYFKDKIQVIDVSQSVEHDHPQALAFLLRDIKNINDFFGKKGVKVFTDEQVFQFIVSLDIVKGKQMKTLEQLILHYDGQNINEQAFGKIKIHQNLSSIPMNEAEKQIFQNKIAHQAITDIKVEPNSQQNKINQQSDDDSEDDSRSSCSNDESVAKKEGENSEDGEVIKQKKEGGKQKYEGLSKLQRKHKVKEEKREKRKDKIPKKEKKKMMKRQ